MNTLIKNYINNLKNKRMNYFKDNSNKFITMFYKCIKANNKLDNLKILLIG